MIREFRGCGVGDSGWGFHAAHAAKLPLERQDHGRGVLWWYSGCGAGDRAGIGVCVREMVIFVGFGCLIGRGN